MGDFWVNMLIKEVKRTYGRFLFLVVPQSGSGSAWVTEGKLYLS